MTISSILGRMRDNGPINPLAASGYVTLLVVSSLAGTAAFVGGVIGGYKLVRKDKRGDK